MLSFPFRIILIFFFLAFFILDNFPYSFDVPIHELENSLLEFLAWHELLNVLFLINEIIYVYRANDNILLDCYVIVKMNLQCS